MTRITWAFLAAGLLALPRPAGAAEDSLTGNWKVTVLLQGQHSTLWIVHLQPRDGQWKGAVVAVKQDAPEVTAVANLSVTPDLLQFTLKSKGQNFPFQGPLPPAASKTIQGSLQIGDNIFPTDLEPTQLTTLDEFEVSKDLVAGRSGGPDLVEAASFLISQAEDHKAASAEVKDWADKAFQGAAAFGPRYERAIAVRVADLLNDQEGYSDLAVDYGRRAEALLKPNDPPYARKRVLETLVEALTRAGKTDDAKEVEARLDKIQWPRLEPHPGRKAHSDRAVLVELFTGAQCLPCVAADMAFDALAKTYDPSEVVLLEYHLHIPGPDPLTNPEGKARQQYYGEDISGTPAILFDGKLDDSGGGYSEDAQEKYQEYYHLINPLLDEPARAQLKVTAVRKGDKVEITAEASDVAKPGPDTRLRLALVEEQVRYKGGNKIPTFSQVVRALPGGPAGLALRDKTGRESVTVDLGELRKQLGVYLADFAQENPFPRKDRPLDLKRLRVVAFVQDDATKQVLQATQVDVRPE